MVSKNIIMSLEKKTIDIIEKCCFIGIDKNTDQGTKLGEGKENNIYGHYDNTFNDFTFNDLTKYDWTYNDFTYIDFTYNVLTYNLDLTYNDFTYNDFTYSDNIYNT